MIRLSTIPDLSTNDISAPSQSKGKKRARAQMCDINKENKRARVSDNGTYATTGKGLADTNRLFRASPKSGLDDLVLAAEKCDSHPSAS